MNHVRREFACWLQCKRAKCHSRVGDFAFGFKLDLAPVQEDVKIKLNHYMAVGERYLDFYTYKYEECDWDAQCMYDARKDWWDRFAPKTRNNFYVTEHTYDIFHHWGEEDMVRVKWGLMAVILMCFFVLDALFLRCFILLKYLSCATN